MTPLLKLFSLRKSKKNSERNSQADFLSGLTLISIISGGIALQSCDGLGRGSARLATALDVPPLEGVQPITLQEARDILDPILGFEGQKCSNCHFDWDDRLKSWATSTLNQAERNRSLFVTAKEAGVDQLIANPQSVSGIFKAYPEYFEEYFKVTGKEAAFNDFAQKVQPDGTGGQMGFATERFSKAAQLEGMDPIPFDDAKAKSDFDTVYLTLLRIAKTISQESEVTCTNQVTDDYKLHIEEMKVSGMQNLYKDTHFYGCATPGNTGADCFPGPSDKSLAPISQNGTELAHRVVKVLDVGNTSFWTRSSMDGRFVANGSGPGKIQDMQRKIQWNVTNTSYDPSFMPNGSGLTFHGGGAIFCTMETITRELTEQEKANKITVNGEEWSLVELNPETNEACIHGNMTSSISTYQSVGSVVGLGKTYVVTGSHVTDGGQGSNGSNLSFSGVLSLFEIDKTARSFGEVKKVSEFQLPNEGDYSLSPSSNFVVGRLAGRSGEFEQSVQLGYRVRSLKEMIATVNRTDGSNTFSAATARPANTVCFNGAGSKPMMSLDERFLAFHQYEENNTANIYIVDLANSNPKPVRVTNFKNGERALFAHFRADGWLYFLVKGQGDSDKLFASNAALLLKPE